MSPKHTACQKKFGMLDHVSWKHRACQRKDAALWDTRPCPKNTKLVRRKQQQLSTIDHVFQKHKACLKEAAAIQDNRLCVSKTHSLPEESFRHLGCLTMCPEKTKLVRRKLQQFRTTNRVFQKHKACQKRATIIWNTRPCPENTKLVKSCSNSEH